MSIRRVDSIRTRLALTFVLIVLLPMSVIGIVVAISGSEGAQAHLSNQLELAASAKVSAITSWATTLQADLGEALIGPEARKAGAMLMEGSTGTGRLREWLAMTLRRPMPFSTLMVWDRDGRPWLSTEATSSGPAFPPLFPEDAQAAGVRPVLLHGVPAILAIRPILGERGELLAILGGAARLQALQEILADPKGLGQTGKAYLLDRNGLLLTHLPGTQEGSRLPETWLQHPSATGTLKGRDHRGVPVNTVHLWLPSLQLQLVTEQDQAESSRSTFVLLAVYTGVALAAILVAIFTALSVTHRIATPLSDLSEAADEIAAGNLGVRADEDREDEIGALAHSFNAMAGNLQRTVAGLRESEEKYRSIFENAMEGIFQSTLPGRFLKVNPATARLLGYDSPEDVMARNLDIERDVYVNPEDRACMLAGLLKHGAFKNLEMQAQRKDGRKIWLSLNTRLVQDRSGGQPFIEGMIIDISERKAHEEELSKHREHLEELVEERTSSLQNSEAKLEELNRSLEERIERAVEDLRRKDQLLISQSRQAGMGEMFGNIAHQWRQPLNTLGLVLSNLEDSYQFSELNPEIFARSMAEGNRLIQKMSSTINDFRNFFLPDKERTTFFALGQIRETAALVEASFRNNHIAIQIEAAEEVALFGFPNEYSQVLLNILSNAKQAIVTSATGEGKVTILLTKEAGCGCVRVRDNGGGIPASIQERIFEPYFSTKEMGTGIGLYMSKQIIERNMGGSIMVRNLEGGAEFVILTPLARQDP